MQKEQEKSINLDDSFVKTRALIQGEQQQAPYDNSMSKYDDQVEQSQNKEKLENPQEQQDPAQNQKQSSLEESQSQIPVISKDSPNKKKIKIILIIFFCAILVAALSFTIFYFVQKSGKDTDQLMKIILKNQEDNIVKRVLRPQISYQYTYQVNTTLDTYSNETYFTQNYTTTNYDVEYVCTNISEEGFKVLLIYKKTTKFDHSGDETVILEFNETQETLQDKDEQNQQKPVVKVHDSQKESENEQKFAFYKSIMEKYDLSTMDLIQSSQPVISFFLLKNGSLSDIQFPYNMKAELFQISPRLIQMFTPPLSKAVYHEQRRRLLQSSDGEEEKSYSFDITSKESILHQQDTITTHQDGVADTDISTIFNSQDGLVIEAHLDQDFEISSDQIKDSRATTPDEYQSSFIINNHLNINATTNNTDQNIHHSTEIDKEFLSYFNSSINQSDLIGEDNFNNYSIYNIDDQETIDNVKYNEQETENLRALHKNESQTHKPTVLMYKMTVDTQIEMKFVGQYEINNLSLIYAGLSQVKMGKIDSYDHFNHFVQNYIRDKESLNSQFFQQETQKRILMEGDPLISDSVIALYTYNMLSYQADASVRFYCEEGKAGQDNDRCFFRLELNFGSFTLPSPYKKIEAPIKKFTTAYNWFKKQVLNKIIDVSQLVKQFLIKLDQDIGQTMDFIDLTLDPEKSPFIKPFQVENSQFCKQTTFLVQYQTINNITTMKETLKTYYNSTFGKLKSSTTESLTQFKNEIVNLPKNISNIINNFASKIQPLIEDVTKVIQNGNPDKVTTNDQVVSINSISQDIDQIKNSFNLGFGQLVKNLQRISKIKQKFEIFTSSMQNALKAPFKCLQNVSKAIASDLESSITSLEAQGLDYMSQFLNQLGFQNLLYNTEDTFLNIQQQIPQISNLLSSKFNNLDSLYSTGLNLILKNFKISNSQSYSLLDETWSKSITTYACFVPITFSMGIQIQSDISFGYSISYNSIRLDAGVGGSFKLRADAAINAAVYKIGVYGEGTLFQGSLNMSLTSTIGSKFSAKVNVQKRQQSFSLKAGIFHQYITIGCDRRMLNQVSLAQQRRENQYKQYFHLLGILTAIKEINEIYPNSFSVVILLNNDQASALIPNSRFLSSFEKQGVQLFQGSSLDNDQINRRILWWPWDAVKEFVQYYICIPYVRLSDKKDLVVAIDYRGREDICDELNLILF